MPDSRFSEEHPNPLYLTEGDRLEPLKKTGTRYSFQHISMKDVAVLEYPEGFDTSSASDLKKFFPSEYSQAVVFSKIEDCVKWPLKDYNGDSSVVADPSEIGGKPCGFITPVGTLIPQIIVPWYTSKNRMRFQNEKYPPQDSYSLDRCTDWYGYTPTGQPANGSAGTGEWYYSTEVMATKYDSFLNSSDFNISSSSAPVRIYQANVKPGMGAFAFLFDIVKVHPNTDDQNPAYVEMSIWGDDCDTITARFYQKGTVNISLYRPGSGSPSTVSGSLSFTEMSQKTTQCKSPVVVHKNAVFFYGLLNRLLVTGDLTTNNEQTSKTISLVRNPDLDLSSIADPDVAEFPTRHKDGDADAIRVNSSNARVRFGDKMRVTWKNCVGSFALSQVRYCPKVKFSFFYRMDGESSGNNDGMGDYSDYFCIESGGGQAGYSGLTSIARSKKIYYDSSKQSTVYRADFVIDNEDNLMSRKPFEILGLIHVVSRKGRLTEIRNKDGNFKKYFDDNIDGLFPVYRKGCRLDNEGKTWIDYLTSVSVSHTLEGTTGTMSLDKYMMMKDLAQRPLQVIGALTLQGHNIVKYGSRSTSHNPYPSLPSGQFFKGYALETADSQSSGSSELTVTLAGIQAKLSSMELVNVPYWDGDRVFGKSDSDDDAVINYFISYSGCDLRYERDFSIGTSSGDDDIDNRKEIVLPRSFDYLSPAVHFNMGTSCLDGIREIARMINHQFVIQPDGRGYFYGMDDYGRPVWITKGPVRWTYDESEILSLRLSPFLENKYNAFLTLSLLGVNSSKQGGVIPEGSQPGMLFSQLEEGDPSDYPWCRVITSKENGILTKSQLRRLHNINVRFGKSRMYTGSVTVPGRNEFYLFDKIRINHGKSHELFYIYGITHNINMQTKEWTTELQVADFNI